MINKANGCISVLPACLDVVARRETVARCYNIYLSWLLGGYKGKIHVHRQIVGLYKQRDREEEEDMASHWSL